MSYEPLFDRLGPHLIQCQFLESFEVLVIVRLHYSVKIIGIFAVVVWSDSLCNVPVETFCNPINAFSFSLVLSALIYLIVKYQGIPNFNTF